MENLSHIFFNAEPNVLIPFGLLLLSGVFAGITANRFAHLPTITAFMLVGFVIGPHGVNLLTADMMAGSQLLIDIALGLILYKLGSMLHPLEILRSRKLTMTSLAESFLTFILVVALVILFDYSLISAVLIGAIAISSSPAILVHVSEELEADGPVTKRTKSLVAMNNILSFLIFTAALPFALSKTGTSFVDMALVPLYQLFISALVGIAVAKGAIRVSKMLKSHDEHYRFVVIVGSIVLTLGFAQMFNGSTLFATLALGIAMRWFENKKSKLSHVGLGEGGDLFYIILFVMAGAKIDPMLVLTVGFLPIVLVLARTLCKFAGVFALTPITGYSRTESSATALLLVPMAGMAIGLVSTLDHYVPDLVGHVSAVVFAMVAVFETAGPFAAVKAFKMSGEAAAFDDEEEEKKALPVKEAFKEEIIKS